MRLLAAAALLAALIPLSGCGGSAHATTHATTTSSANSASSGWAGAVANPPFAAKPIKLNNWDGTPVDLSKYHGKAVLVLFIYDHCPDTCPLMVGHLHSAQAELGPQAKKMQIVAVSVDPRGDTPKTVRHFLQVHQMLGRMNYLIGSRSQLQPVWKRWGILAKADPTSPDAVEHSALIYGITASGKVTTLYPSNFKPSDIVHDVPRLAAQ
jgi:protein SCO1/2